MSSLFLGEKALRTRYLDMTEAQINAANDVASAYLLARFTQQSRIVLFDNGFNTDIALYLVHPNANPQDAANRLKWIELPGQKPINFDISGTVGLSFDAGTSVYVVRVGSAATNSSKLRLITWG